MVSLSPILQIRRQGATDPEVGTGTLPSVLSSTRSLPHGGTCLKIPGRHSQKTKLPQVTA